MKKNSQKSNAVLTGLLDFLDDTGGKDLLSEVSQSLNKEVAKQKETDEIIVTSVIKLTPQQLKNIKVQTEKLLNVKLPVINKIDASLIGGFTIKVNDWLMDSSISHQMEILKRSLLS